MVPLAGKPILEHQLDLARRYGCEEAVLLTGHLGECIEVAFRRTAAITACGCATIANKRRWGRPAR